MAQTFPSTGIHLGPWRSCGIRKFEPVSKTWRVSASRGFGAPREDAEWFDSTVAQYDAFGRPRAPSEASERFFVDWAERRRSAAIACQAPGCTGSATLEVFNASEEHRGCVGRPALGLCVCVWRRSLRWGPFL